MKPIILDVKSALKAMLVATGACLYEFGQVMLFLSIGGGLCWGLGYCLVNWTLYSIITIVALALFCWFIIELDYAKFVREKEQQDC